MQKRDDGGDLVRDDGVECFLSSPVPGYPERDKDASNVGAERDGPAAGQRAREPGAGDGDAEGPVDGLGKGARWVVVRRVDGDL